MDPSLLIQEVQLLACIINSAEYNVRSKYFHTTQYAYRVPELHISWDPVEVEKVTGKDHI